MSRKRSHDRSKNDEVLARIRELEKSIYSLRAHLRDTSEIDEQLDDALHLIVCKSGDVLVSFRLNVIDEVVPAAQLEPIPEAPPWVSGTLTLRGVSMPVLDVSARVARTRRALRASDRILIARVNEVTYGLVVQEVVDIQIADKSMVQPPPLDLEVAPYVLGTVAHTTGVHHLLSAQRLVAYSDIPELA